MSLQLENDLPEIRSLQFEHWEGKKRVLTRIAIEQQPTYPLADWDAHRDLGPDGSRARIIVIAPKPLSVLHVRVRFTSVPTFQQIAIWACRENDPQGTVVVEELVIEEVNPGCISREFTFTVTDDDLLDAGVARRDVRWHWFARVLSDGGDGSWLGGTDFRVYRILKRPTSAPWTDDPGGNADADLPLAAALDWATVAADGETTLAGACGAVTRHLFALGDASRPAEGRRRFGGSESDLFLCDEEHHVFRFRAFVSAMEGTGAENVDVACTDMASALCLFANVLGADLVRTHLAPIPPERLLETNEITLIGSGPAEHAWIDHVVARSKASRKVFDAYLQFKTTSAGAVVWSSPANLPLTAQDAGKPGVSYVDRLLRSDPAECASTTLEGITLDRRKQEVTAGAIRGKQQQVLAWLGPNQVPVLIDRPSLDGPALLGGRFEPLDRQLRETGLSAKGTWHQGSKRVSAFVQWLPTANAALMVAAWHATFFHTLRLGAPAVPGAPPMLTTTDRDAGITVAANLVFVLSAKGDGPGAAEQVWADLVRTSPLLSIL